MTTTSIAEATNPVCISVAAPCAPPVRVMHVINGEHYAGAERVQDLLAQGLPAQGFEVGFACVKSDRFGRLRQCRQTPLFEFHMRNRADLTVARSLAKLISDQGYRLVHTHTPRAVMIGRAAAALARVPVLHHVHSPTDADSTRPWRNWANATVEKFALTGVAGLVAVSESMGRYARRIAGPSTRVWVVPNGVPARDNLPSREPPREPWTLGAIALFRPRKGLEILLEAMAQLRAAGRTARLRVVGDFESPDYRRQIVENVQQLGLEGSIDWVGFTSDVNRELGQMDALVLPSLFGEGLPMVVLEAMAAGVPVVATRVEGTPEAIRDGIDGLIVNPGDASDLALALTSLMSGRVDWQAMRTSAYRRQIEKFSDRSMAAGLAQIYREVLA